MVPQLQHIPLGIAYRVLLRPGIAVVEVRVIVEPQRLSVVIIDKGQGMFVAHAASNQCAQLCSVVHIFIRIICGSALACPLSVGIIAITEIHAAHIRAVQLPSVAPRHRVPLSVVV